jgi:PAS domain-containing protein
VDGRIIFCDHRISIVAGYMSEEVSGTSAFKFMHKDDVRWTIVVLRHSKFFVSSFCFHNINVTFNTIRFTIANNFN